MQTRVPCVGFVLDGQTPQRERGKGVPVRTKAPSAMTTFGQHIRTLTLPANLDSSGNLNAEVIKVLEAIEQGVKDISLLLRYGLRTADGNAVSAPDLTRTPNKVWQRDVIRHDERAGEILLDALRSTRTCAVALETHEGVIDWCEDNDSSRESSSHDGSSHGASAPPPAPAPAPAAAVSYDPYDYYTSASISSSSPSATSPQATPKPAAVRKARFAVVLDPLGHCLNADAGANVGTIFGIYLATGNDAYPSSHVLKNTGGDLLAAGYALYGSATQLVLSMGGTNGVDGFTLHPVLDEFTLTRPRIQIPQVGRFYSVNLGHRNQWSYPIQKHVDGLGEFKSLRYLGTFLADCHRTLLYGGVFLYPPSRKRPAGKLRLLFEITPIAFLMEQAGGACSTGAVRTLDVAPTSINQRTPVAFGSRADVENYVRECAEAISHPIERSSSPLASPLIAPPMFGSSSLEASPQHSQQQARQQARRDPWREDQPAHEMPRELRPQPTSFWGGSFHRSMRNSSEESLESFALREEAAPAAPPMPRGVMAPRALSGVGLMGLGKPPEAASMAAAPSAPPRGLMGLGNNKPAPPAAAEASAAPPRGLMSLGRSKTTQPNGGGGGGGDAKDKLLFDGLTRPAAMEALKIKVDMS